MAFARFGQHQGVRKNDGGTRDAHGDVKLVPRGYEGGADEQKGAKGCARTVNGGEDVSDDSVFAFLRSADDDVAPDIGPGHQDAEQGQRDSDGLVHGGAGECADGVDG